ncbi:2TM domain-containing protein [Robiginitalea sp. SC105]|uniref:2TM domain-containing protein n=1 Tax=Robiginitalea sp. SC105 TaxID=2762332 RepID=UPI001639F595|nr:2TM domain-containing protein [Robiginitalea sp. SC105]MBC2839370.1 2TM domain-containing protein [Robiginitalea sp. SC105]
MNENDKLERAKKRVAEIKGFYVHLSIYLVINVVILVVHQVNGFHENGGWFAWNTLFTPLFWGIGLAFHGAKVFGWIPFFGKKWEEEQIRKYMERDRKESDKFK